MQANNVHLWNQKQHMLSLNKSSVLNKSASKAMGVKKNIQIQKKQRIYRKYMNGQQQFQTILNYFVYNNFQDLNTWQQIAKTRTQYHYQQINSQRFFCQVLLKWQISSHQSFSIKCQGKTKKQSKRNSLTKLIQQLMIKGMIGYGFKEEDFVRKLIRRKPFQDQDDQIQLDAKTKAITTSILKTKHNQTIIQHLNQQNFVYVWEYAIFTRDLLFCQQVLQKMFGKKQDNTDKMEKSQINIDRQRQCALEKQVSYVEQFKNPFEEDLTVFIRYYLLQRPKYIKKSFKQYDVSIQNSISMTLPSMTKQLIQLNSNKCNPNNLPLTIDKKLQIQQKRRLNLKKPVTRQFYSTDYKIQLPIFQEDQSQNNTISMRIIQSLYNRVLFICQDFQYCQAVLRLLNCFIKNIQFQKKKQKEEAKNTQNHLENAQFTTKYYKQMKFNLITQMVYNLNIKLKNISSPQSFALTIEGMLSPISGHNLSGEYNFIAKQPESVLCQKIQRKSNLNQFSQQNQFCLQQVVLLKNKLTQACYIGIIKQLTQSMIIRIPFLSFQQVDQLSPFSIHRLLNSKIYNKLSSSLIHTCKNYMNWINLNTNGSQNVQLVYTISMNISILQELISQYIAKKQFTLIVSDHFQQIHKSLTQKGFNCLKIAPNIDQKVINKHNVICGSPLNIATDLLSNVAFDNVIIDEVQKVPQIISLLSITKCLKRLFLIGDPNLPHSQMNCNVSKRNKMQISLFERLISQKHKYLTINYPLKNQQIQSSKKLYDLSIVEWLRNSLYGKDLNCDQQSTNRKKTPIIKGFNWPCSDYRVCFINYEKPQRQNRTKSIHHQSFILTCIMAQVLKSGFTDLQQISLCSLNVQNYLILQHYLLAILINLNISKLLWNDLIKKLLKTLDGSRWNSNDLIMVLVGDGGNQANLKQIQRKLYAAILQAERGLIFIGNCQFLANKSLVWANFIDWCYQKKLILNYSQPK